MSCTEIVHSRWKSCRINAALRPFIDRLRSHKHHNKRNPDRLYSANAIIWRFYPVFFSRIRYVFFPILVNSFPLQAIFFLNGSQSNQQIMCPTSSHRKTQIPHIFCTEKKHGTISRSNRMKKKKMKKNNAQQRWEFRSSFQNRYERERSEWKKRC